MRTQTPLRVHWIRHGKIASHQGDVPLTDDGREQAEAVGRQLTKEVSSDEDIFFLYAPTRSTRETALTTHECDHDATSVSRIRPSCEPSYAAIFWVKTLANPATVSR